MHTTIKRSKMWPKFKSDILKTRISIPYPLFKGPRLPMSFRLLSNAFWHFVNTVPKSDAFQFSAVPDMPIRIKAKFAMQ